MKRASVFGAALVLVANACGGDSKSPGAQPATAGGGTDGGGAGSGEAPSDGGATLSSGGSSSGGTPYTGGAPPITGGGPAAGGIQGTAGSSAGGTPYTGGASSDGGAASSSGGAAGTIGSGGTTGQDAGADSPVDAAPTATGYTGPTCGGLWIDSSARVAPAECSACLDAKCCAIATSCGNDAECKALRECFKACSGNTDDACFNACSAAHVTSLAYVSRQVTTCRDGDCNLPCSDRTCFGSEAGTPTTGANTKARVTNGSIFAIAGTVKVCGLADTTCAAPTSSGDIVTASTEATIAVTPTAGGMVGYLEATGTPFMPAVYYPYQRRPSSPPYFDVYLWTPGAFGYFAQLLGATVDSARGHIRFSTFDCSDVPLADVAVTVTGTDAQSRTAYLQPNGAADASLTQTTSYGVGFIMNVPPGIVVVSATVPSEGLALISRSTVIVRAGYLTSVDLGP
jgi:hypothetical protein